MLVAEAIFLVIDRKVWHYNLSAETYRLIDLGVIVGLLLVGLALPAFFEKDRRRRGIVYLDVALRASVVPSDLCCCGRSS